MKRSKNLLRIFFAVKSILKPGKSEIIHSADVLRLLTAVDNYFRHFAKKSQIYILRLHSDKMRKQS